MSLRGLRKRSAGDGKICKYMISVIIPLKSVPRDFPAVCARVCTGEKVKEVIYVGNTAVIEQLRCKYSFEHVIAYKEKGRGTAMAEGVRRAQGEVLLFLHADTILPEKWDSYIVEVLEDKNVVGGAFALRFDQKNVYLQFLTFLSILLYKVTGELWGDRALFVRKRVFEICKDTFAVPIMEDVRLSRCMRKQGSTRLIPRAVVTVAGKFREQGYFTHTLRILKCRTFYIFGKDLDELYEYYYRK